MSQKNETLREYLDRINIGPGDDSGFILKEGLFGGTEMQVSRRYLESEPWCYLLDREIIDFYQDVYNIYGQKTVLFVVSDKES